MFKDAWRLAMKKLLLVVLALAAGTAAAQTNVRVRGTIEAVQADALSLKGADGSAIRLELAPTVGVAAAKAIRLEDLKPGAYIGVAARKGADGALVATDIHPIGPQVPSGYVDNWDLGPGFTMTNANLEGVVQSAGGRQITLKYKDGAKTILVPDSTPVVDFEPADRSALKAGETVFAAARKEADGRLVAQRVFVSRNGVKPGF
ncbi:MAG: DUF5666 domain-containing protein [Clostridia bacterium]